MNLKDAIIQKIKKPCEHEFDCFNVSKKIYKSIKLSSNINKAIIQSINPKYNYKHRYIAQCPICNKTWFSFETKNILLKSIKQMNKKYYFINNTELFKGKLNE